MSFPVGFRRAVTVGCRLFTSTSARCVASKAHDFQYFAGPCGIFRRCVKSDVVERFNTRCCTWTQEHSGFVYRAVDFELLSISEVQAKAFAEQFKPRRDLEKKN